MDKFKSGRMPIVVATDVAARGLGKLKKMFSFRKRTTNLLNTIKNYLLNY